jgi:hypothetical protein
LGGYDDKRFNASQQISYPFDTDNELDLTVYIQSIHEGWAGPGVNDPASSMEPLSQRMTIAALIDSSRPFIYLPPDIVDKIAQDWSLQRVSVPNGEYYVVNETQHQTLLRQKPFLRFRLGQAPVSVTPSQNGNEKANIDITLTYEALSHVLDYPYAAKETQFIPIRATNNSRAYMLGRTFLQEAYLTVDHDRKKFSVAPALFPPPNSRNVVPICAQNASSCLTPSTKPGLPIATIAGIAAGSGAFLIIVVLALVFLRRSKLHKRREAEKAAILAQKETDLQSAFSPNTPSEKRFEITELDSGVVHESGGMPTYPTQEMPTPDTASTEMLDESTLTSYGEVYKHENDVVDGRPIIKVFYEMDATPTSTPNETPTGTLSSGDTLVTPPDRTLTPLIPPSRELLRQMNDGHGSDLSPIPQTPLEYYGGAASNGTAGQRGWIGRAPDMPRVVFTPATPGSPTPEEVERNRWLRGHSGRRKRTKIEEE